MSKPFFTLENTTWKTSEMVLTMPSVGVRTRSVLTHRKTPMAVTNMVRRNSATRTAAGKGSSGTRKS